jgi:hypothetical protein
VQSYAVQPDRSVIMTCFHPDHGENIKIRLLPLELDSTLLAVRAPGRTSTKRRSA